MLASSEDFKKSLKSPSKELFLKMEIYDSQMNFIQDITKKVSKNDIGSISVDRGRSVRRSFSFSLNNENGDFTWSEGGLIWIDKRVKIYLGLKLRDKTIEYIPQGVFILTEPEDSHTTNGKITTLSGQDKTYLFTDKRGKLTNELTLATGLKITTAIKTIAQSGGETKFLFDNVADTIPYELNFSSGDNRWKVMDDLAKLAKCDIFYDVNGYLALRKIEDLNDLQNDSPVWTFSIGDGFYAGNVRRMDESQLYNDFITIGGGSQTKVVRHQLTVTETNPLFVNSPYSIEKIGRITYFHNNGEADSLLTKVDECLWRNKHSLMKYLGYVERINLTIAPHFLLDCGDIIQIEDDSNDVTGRYLIEKFDLPISPSLMNFEVSKELRVVTDWNSIT